MGSGKRNLPGKGWRTRGGEENTRNEKNQNIQHDNVQLKEKFGKILDETSKNHLSGRISSRHESRP